MGIETNGTRWSVCSLWCGRGGQQARGGSTSPEFAGEEATTQDEEGPDSFDVDHPGFNQWSRKKKRWSAHLPDKSAGRGGCRWPRDRAVHGGGCVREREGEERSSGEKARVRQGGLRGLVGRLERWEGSDGRHGLPASPLYNTEVGERPVGGLGCTVHTSQSAQQALSYFPSVNLLSQFSIYFRH